MITYIVALFFWGGIFLVFYTYIGYGIVLYLLVKLKRIFGHIQKTTNTYMPDVTFVVAAYNEESYINDKIQNCLDFDYPKDKIHFLFVTDGSSDETPNLINSFNYPQNFSWSLHHDDARNGKIAAVERIMPFVKTPIVIYTDANTHVNKGAIKMIARHYQNPKVGAVAGEKRISMGEKEDASAAGEGMYWKYESKLKQWDSELNTVVGAAGELFSLRTELYEPVSKDMVIEDFFMTLRIAQKGYKVVYEPKAFAVEASSASVKEELKRKIRIAAGGIQAIVRLAPLLNIFKYGLLSFQYISHRVLRWTLAPVALVLIFLSNIYLCSKTGSTTYLIFMGLQILFYGMALVGYLLEKRKIKVKALFVPYYFTMMNYAVFRGIFRYFKGSQSVVWEKAKRADEVAS